MTFQGIAESMIATAIWAALAYMVKSIKDRFEKQKDEYRKILDVVNMDVLQNTDLNFKVDIYYMTNMLNQRFRHDLLKIENVKHTILLILLVLLVTLPNTMYIGLALQTLFFGMLAYINVTRNGLIVFIDDLETAIMKGVATHVGKQVEAQARKSQIQTT